MRLVLSARPLARRALAAAIGTLVAATLAAGTVSASHASGDLAGRKVGRVALKGGNGNGPIKYTRY